MDVFTLSHNDQELLIYRKLNERAKRLSLRPGPSSHAFVLTIPRRTPERAIHRFLAGCTGWIETCLEKRATVKAIGPGEDISLFGIPFQCVTDPLRRRPALCAVTQTVRLPSQYTQQNLHTFLKQMAEDYLTPYVLEMVDLLGQSIEKVVFRDTKTRWGSCSIKRVISLNWRLILAPPEVAKYVCVHEAVHLIHMNHSQAFWKRVEDICPSYKIHRKWLKTQGYSLMGV